MKKILVLAGLMLFTQCLWAYEEGRIECILSPRLFVGNVHFDVDTKNKTFQITYDDPVNPIDQIVSVQGQVYVGEKDSMGFDRIYLCTGQPCSGSTYLGDLKAVDQEQGKFSDRESYFRVNPHSGVPIKVSILDRETYITGLNALKCYYR